MTIIEHPVHLNQGTPTVHHSYLNLGMLKYFTSLGYVHYRTSYVPESGILYIISYCGTLTEEIVLLQLYW